MPGWYLDEDPKLTLRKWLVDRDDSTSSRAVQK